MTEVAGRCQVTVGMNYDRATDQGSWLGLRYAAKHLNELCAREKKRRYKGGWLRTGDKNFILIRLSWAGSLVGGNETLVDTEDVQL